MVSESFIGHQNCIILSVTSTYLNLTKTRTCHIFKFSQVRLCHRADVLIKKNKFVFKKYFP